MQSVPAVPVGGSRLGLALRRPQFLLLVPDLRILGSLFRVWTYPLLPRTVTWVLSRTHHVEPATSAAASLTRKASLQATSKALRTSTKPQNVRLRARTHSVSANIHVNLFFHTPPKTGLAFINDGVHMRVQTCEKHPSQKFSGHNLAN